MTTKQQSSQRRVHCASTLITLAVVVLFGCSQKALAQSHNLTRTLPTTVNNEVDIGDFAFTNGAGSLWISVTVPSSGYSVAKEYLLPIQHNQNANVWQTALPAASTGSNNGNDFALDIKVNQGTASLRLRTTASSGGNVGTAYIVIKQEGASDTFTGSTTTSAVSAPTAFFGSTALTQVGGNVGIGTASPGQILHLSSAATSGTGLRIDNTDTGGRGFRLLSTGTGNSSGAGRFHLLDETSAASRLTVDSSGNVGVGTASPVFDGNPARYLTVDGGPGVLGSIGAAGGTTNLNYPVSQVAFINSNLGTPEKRLATIVGGTDTVTNSGVLDFFTASAGAFTLPPRMRINSSGNVGIGTSSPTTRLDVAGQIRSSTGGFKFPDGTVQTTAAGSGAVSSVFGRTGAVVAANNDYTWAQIDKTTSSLADITTRSASDLSSGTVATARLGSGTANTTTFLRGDNTWATVTGGSSQWGSTPGPNGTTDLSYNSGNVGIGTTTPAVPLDLKGNNVSFGGQLRLQAPDFAQITFYNSNSPTLSSANRLGHIYYDMASTSLFIDANLGNKRLLLQAAGGGGNVGIGTSAPAFKLDVAGDIRANALRFPDGSFLNTAPLAGPAQPVFKNVANAVGTPQFSASSNDDSLRFEGTGGTSVTFDNATKKVIINSSTSPGGPGSVSWAQVDKSVSSLADITTRNAGDLSSGTLPDARFPATLPAASGVNLTGLNASNLANGTVATARLGSGTANSTTFLRGDNTWAALTSSQWTTSGANINYAPAGNVGIGTAAPTSKLHVSGDGKFTGNLTVDGNIAAKYQDVAEWVESSQELSAGTVVVVDHTKSNQVIASSQAYDTRVAGVISSQPGIALGEAAENRVLVATTGRVRIRVDASYGPIQVGDLLVTSDISGAAMKSQPVILSGIQLHRPGTLVGKALEPLAKGRGEILVLLSLQ